MLEKFLVSSVFAFLLVFCRMGSAMMLLPGIGEAYVPPRIRLVFALMISLILAPITEPLIPPLPASPLSLMVLLAAEITIGVFIGLISRILISTMHTTGMIIAMQSGLASAQMFDMNMGTQGSLFGNLLSIMAVTALFALNLHHVMLAGVANSYTLFAPGAFPPMGDLVNTIRQVISSVFLLAFSLSTPHIVAGLIMYLISGVMSRLMPTMQVFFIIMPLQILAAVFILIAALGTIMLVYMDHFENLLRGFLIPA